MKLERILLTTDLSREALRAFAPTSALARQGDARVSLLHVVPILVPASQDAMLATPIGPPDYESETKAAEDALEAQAKELPSDLEVSMLVVRGTHVASTIVAQAQEQRADLVALATHGRSGIRRLALGSVAEEVLRRSQVPVLCFPPHDAARRDAAGRFDHLLLTTDLSEESLRPFGPVLELARAARSRVTVLHVLPELQAIPYGAAFAPPVVPPDLPRELERARQAVAELCSKLLEGVAAGFDVVAHATPAIGIAEYARDHDVDLIALSTHGRTGFRRLALGSVAEQVIRHSTVPVLSFHRLES